MWLPEFINEAYEIRAFVASTFVGITCGILGCFIVLRNMALIGDALSHAILPGVVVGFLFAGYNILAFFVGAVLAGFLAAIIITWLQRNARTRDDSAIGIVFTIMFAFGVIGISSINRQGVHLDMKDFLFGTALGVSDQDLWLTGSIAVFVALSVIVFYRQFFISSFQAIVGKTLGVSTGAMHYFLMLLLSFAIVAALQSVGVILVVAMLIIPASTALILTNHLNRMIIVSALFGFLSTSLGLYASIKLNTPPGPAMTIVGGLFYGLALLFSPKRGIVLKSIRNYRKKRHIAEEDAIKLIWKLEVARESKKPLPTTRIERGVLKRLKRKEKAQFANDQVELTQSGRKDAKRLVRAHRLWETYLISLGIDGKQVHYEAERLEHLMPDEFLDRLDADLGYPEKDNHGSPIPRID